MNRIAAALCLLPLALGCEPEGVAPTTEIAARLAKGAEFVRFQGTRVYTNHFSNAPVQTKEGVASDGEGRFSLQLLERDGLDEKAFTERFGAKAWAAAKGKFHLASAYAFALRDFRVLDHELFLRNYLIGRQVKPGSVAGRETLDFEVWRSRGGRSYLLSLDKEFDLPLRIVERDGSGRVLSTLEYVAVDFRPDLSKAALRPVKPKAEPVADWGKASERLGFAPYVPVYLPEGFGRRAAEVVEFQDGSLALVDLYTDGVENFSVREREQPFTVLYSPEELAALKARAEEDAFPARRFSLGPLTAIETYVGQTLITVWGKLDAEEMTYVAESLIKN